MNKLILSKRKNEKLEELETLMSYKRVVFLIQNYKKYSEYIDPEFGNYDDDRDDNLDEGGNVL